MHSGEQVIGRNGVSEAEAQRATATSDSLGAATPNMAASEELADRVAVSLRHLIIGGRVVVHDGEIPGLDLAKLRHDAAGVVARLMA